MGVSTDYGLGFRGGGVVCAYYVHAGRDPDSWLDRVTPRRPRGGVFGCGVWVWGVFKPKVQRCLGWCDVCVLDVCREGARLVAR
jgi:hypothetical protein